MLVELGRDIDHAGVQTLVEEFDSTVNQGLSFDAFLRLVAKLESEDSTSHRDSAPFLRLFSLSIIGTMQPKDDDVVDNDDGSSDDDDDPSDDDIGPTEAAGVQVGDELCGINDAYFRHGTSVGDVEALVRPITGSLLLLLRRGGPRVRLPVRARTAGAENAENERPPKTFGRGWPPRHEPHWIDRLTISDVERRQCWFTLQRDAEGARSAPGAFALRDALVVWQSALSARGRGLFVRSRDRALTICATFPNQPVEWHCGGCDKTDETHWGLAVSRTRILAAFLGCDLSGQSRRSNSRGRFAYRYPLSTADPRMLGVVPLVRGGNAHDYEQEHRDQTQQIEGRHKMAEIIEDDVLFTPVARLERFDDTLSSEDAEALLCLLSAPRLRVPLVAAWFAADRTSALLHPRVRRVFSTVLFAPGRWLPHSANIAATAEDGGGNVLSSLFGGESSEPASTFFVPAQSPGSLGTPRGALLSELEGATPGATLTPLLKLLCDGAKFARLAGGVHHYSQLFFFVVRIAARLYTYVRRARTAIASDGGVPESKADDDTVDNATECGRVLEAAEARLRVFLDVDARSILELWIADASSDKRLSCRLHAHAALLAEPLARSDSSSWSPRAASKLLASLAFVNTWYASAYRAMAAGADDARETAAGAGDDNDDDDDDNDDDDDDDDDDGNNGADDDADDACVIKTLDDGPGALGGIRPQELRDLLQSKRAMILEVRENRHRES